MPDFQYGQGYGQNNGGAGFTDPTTGHFYPAPGSQTSNGTPLAGLHAGYDFGQTPGGANAASNYFAGLAGDARAQQAPTIDVARSNASRAQAAQSLGLLGQSAAGGGPGATYARAQFGQNLQDAMRAQASAGNNFRGAGGPSGALGSYAAGGGAMGSAVGQSGADLARFTSGAQAGYAQGAMGLQNQDAANALAQMRLQEQQNRINLQGSLQNLGLSNDIQQHQLAADTAINAQVLSQAGTLDEANQKTRQAQVAGGMGLLTGGLSGLGGASGGGG